MKAKTQSSRTGDGRDCISHPEHGTSIILNGGREWCAHQSHDGRKARGEDPGVEPTTPFLDKQVAPGTVQESETPALEASA